MAIVFPGSGSIFSSTSTILQIVVVATATAFGEAFMFVLSSIRTAANWITERIATAASRLPQLHTDWADALVRPLVALVKARAFVERIASRELRRFTVGWRACPSI